MASLIVLDASVLIAHLDARDMFHAQASELLLAAADRPMCASVLTVAEILVGPTRAGVLSAAREALALLRVDTIGLRVDSGERLAALRASSGPTLPECCVLLAAQDSQAGTVLTFDDRLRKAATRAGYAIAP